MADSGKIVIEVNLADMFVHGESTFAEYVASSAVQKIIASADSNGLRDLRDRVKQIRDEEIREAVRPIIEDALVQALQPTDGFGTPKGEPTTLREVIAKTVEEELRSTRDQSGGGGRMRTSVVQQVIVAEVDKVLRREMQEAVAEAKGEVLAALRDKAGEVIAETIQRAARGTI